MNDREKALEAALRLARDMLSADYQRLGIVPVEALVIRTIDAALAMPATVDRASWTPPEDRPDGYVCLGLVPVTWHGEVMGWRDSGMEQVDPLGFAPPPEDKP
jgi:hypothetical protein